MKRQVWCAIVLSVFSLFWTLSAGWAQGVLVIEGGTLIDGNGGQPVRDSLIVVRGNKIESVSRKGQATPPPGATVIKADGKFIVPGLMDAHIHYDEWLPELFLGSGVTSIFEIGGGGEWGIAQRDGINHGRIPGPRIFLAVGSLAGARIAALGGNTGVEALGSRLVANTPERGRELAKRFIAAGADMIKVHRGPPMEVYQAAIEEAHKAGLPAVAQPLGPTVYAREAVMAGADILEHAAGVGYSIAKDPAKWKGWGDIEEHSLDPSIYSDMDDAKAADLIKLLIQKNVYLEPDFVCQGRGLMNRRNEYELEDYRLLHLPALAYVPKQISLKYLDNYTEFDDVEPAVRDLRVKGFHNMQRFIAQYVKAGGKVLSGTDASGNGWAVAGLGLHHELDVMVTEAGLTPMQAIMASTKNTAEAFRLKDKLGTIEPGKLADLIIVNEDPLLDIRNLQKLDQVIKDGKVIDRTYHAWFKNPLPNSAVEGSTWIQALKKESETMRTTSFGQLSPGIEIVTPSVVTEGSPTLTLTLKGVGFTKRSVVNFDGSPVPSVRLNDNEMKITVDAGRLAHAGTYAITVTNPEPLQRPQWGGTSNKAFLLVNFKY